MPVSLPRPTTVAIPLFDGFTALDAIGPYEVLQRVPEVEVVFVGHSRGEVRSDTGMVGIVRDATLEEVPSPDVVVVPGGPGTRPLTGDDRILDWVRTVHTTSTWTTSVCTGSMVLAAAGLLDGVTATTHWAVRPELAALAAIPVDARVVEHPDLHIVTAAGVSSGIDMALRLVELLVDTTAARAAQLMIEYDPAPPVDSGSVAKASETTLARAADYFAAGRS